MTTVENRILKALPPEEFDRLRPLLEKVQLKMDQPLYKAGVPLQYVYFPETAVASDLVTLSDGTTMEVATMGREGMVGIPLSSWKGIKPLKPVYARFPEKLIECRPRIYASKLSKTPCSTLFSNVIPRHF